MDVRAYLERIRYHGHLQPDIESLRCLHQAHMLAVPFENLDIPRGKRIVLEEDLLYEKIVTRRRGGFCYELNGLFASLLRELGFQVQRLSARVANEQGSFGIPFDHMTLMVRLDEDWLADVGFGEAFRQPLLLDERGIQTQTLGRYRLSADGDQLTYWREEAGTWKPQYLFDTQPYDLPAFEQGCRYHQTSPNSSFTQRRVCSLATPEGRVTLSENRLLITADGRQTERAVSNEAEYSGLLEEVFGVVL